MIWEILKQSLKDTSEKDKSALIILSALRISSQVFSKGKRPFLTVWSEIKLSCLLMTWKCVDGTQWPPSSKYFIYLFILNSSSAHKLGLREKCLLVWKLIRGRKACWESFRNQIKWCHIWPVGDHLSTGILLSWVLITCKSLQSKTVLSVTVEWLNVCSLALACGLFRLCMRQVS